MPDDTTPPREPDSPATTDPTDRRDEAVAELLAVSPLDDVTRHRLVRTAIRSGGGTRSTRRLLSAAAVAVVLVMGAGVVIALSAQEGGTPTAARSKAESVAPSAGASAFSVGSGALDLGAFGDLGVAANATRLRGAFDTARAGSARTPVPAAADSAGSDTLVTRLRALGCEASALPPGTAVAVASGTLDGRAVIAVDIERPTGTHSYFTIATDTCTVKPLS